MKFKVGTIYQYQTTGFGIEMYELCSPWKRILDGKPADLFLYLGVEKQWDREFAQLFWIRGEQTVLVRNDYLKHYFQEFK